MQLDHEKFEGIKELAEISTKISAGTAALATLKSSEEEYLAERDEKLVKRLEAALVDSSDLIKSIGENHDALVGYRNLVVEFYEKVLSLLQGVKEAHALVDDAATRLDAQITKHEKEVIAFKEASNLTNIRLESDRAELAAWQGRLIEGQALLDDRTAMLERTIKRLNN